MAKSRNISKSGSESIEQYRRQRDNRAEVDFRRVLGEKATLRTRYKVRDMIDATYHYVSKGTDPLNILGKPVDPAEVKAALTQQYLEAEAEHMRKEHMTNLREAQRQLEAEGKESL